MNVGNEPAGITKYMTATMMQMMARTKATSLIECSSCQKNEWPRPAGKASMLGGHGRAARFVLVGHAFLYKLGARRAGQLLIVGAELADRSLAFRRDPIGRCAWQQDGQHSDGYGVAKHGSPPP